MVVPHFGNRCFMAQVWDYPSSTGFFSQSYYTIKVNPLPRGGARQAMENEGIG